MTGRFRPTVTRSTAGNSEPPVSPSQVVDFIGARVHVDIVIPRTSIAGKMRLVSRREDFEATAEARAFLADSGFPIDGTGYSALGTAETFSHELQARLLAVAIRDPADVSRALATVDDYRELDGDQLDILGAHYRDLRAKLDPIGAMSLEPKELEAMLDAAKKKDMESLMAFGSAKLARFAITSADQPAS